MCSPGKRMEAVNSLDSALLARDSRVRCSYSGEEGTTQAAADGGPGIPVSSDSFPQNLVLQ